jgi:glutathione S-transferase
LNIVNTAIYPQTRPTFLVEKNPGGKVPVLQKGDLIITESIIVSDYFDEKFPGPKLHPDCPEQKALDRMCVEKNDKVK